MWCLLRMMMYWNEIWDPQNSPERRRRSLLGAGATGRKCWDYNHKRDVTAAARRRGRFLRPGGPGGPIHDAYLDWKRHRWDSRAELQRSAETPFSCTCRESRQTLILECWSNPPSRVRHTWFSESSQNFITTIEPCAKLTRVRQRSWWRIWPRFVMDHSWLPPLSWHW